MLALSRFLRPNRHALGKELRSPLFWVTLIVLLLFSKQLGHIWPFEYAGLRSREILLHNIPARAAEYTRIVAVNSHYYDHEFGSDCVPGDKLLARVRGLLKYQPAVLVVDFDTSSKTYARMPVPGEGGDTSVKDIPVIW